MWTKFLVFLAAATPAFADIDSQLHIRWGVTRTAISGYSLPVPPATNFSTFDIMNEIFISNRSSVLFRFVVSPDFQNNQVTYSSAGVGQRFYIWSKGLLIDRKDQDIAIESLPKWRYTVGWDFGLAQAIIQRISTTVYDVTSSLFELGLAAGVSRRITSRLSLEIELNASFGYGFSKITANTLIVKGLAGTSYFF